MDCLRLSTEKNIEENSRGRKWLAFVFFVCCCRCAAALHCTVGIRIEEIAQYTQEVKITIKHASYICPCLLWQDRFVKFCQCGLPKLHFFQSVSHCLRLCPNGG